MRVPKFDDKIKAKENNSLKIGLLSPKHKFLAVKQYEEKSLKKTQIIEKNNNLNLFENDFDIGNEFQKYYPEGNIGSVLKTMKNDIIKIPNQILSELIGKFKISRKLQTLKG